MIMLLKDGIRSDYISLPAKATNTTVEEIRDTPGSFEIANEAHVDTPNSPEREKHSEQLQLQAHNAKSQDNFIEPPPAYNFSGDPIPTWFASAKSQSNQD
jgi:hypothetical protein